MWKTILTYVEEIGLRMGWSISEDLADVSGGGAAAADSFWKRIQTFQRQIENTKDDHNHSQLFFVSALLLFKSVIEYVVESRHGSIHGEAVVMVEAFMKFNYDQLPDPAANRRRSNVDSNDRVIEELVFLIQTSTYTI